jgi:tetratricopeptide (TPR) repeat protein
MNDSAPGPGPTAIPPEAEQAFLQAVKLQQAGAHAQAISHYKAAVAAHRDFADAWNNLGIAYRATGNYRQAISAYREALRIDPGRATLLSNLGNALKDAGQIEQAVTHHRRALALDPNNAALLHNCGIAEKGRPVGGGAGIVRAQYRARSQPPGRAMGPRRDAAAARRLRARLAGL